MTWPWRCWVRGHSWSLVLEQGHVFLECAQCAAQTEGWWATMPQSDSDLHTHPCRHCHTPTECWGEREPNDDGWPVFHCRIYHREGGPDFLCDACRRLADVQRVLEQP